MADPSPYVVSYSFGGFQANNPTTPLPAGALDNELANIATSIAQLGAFAENVIRADGALQNNIVTFDSLEVGLQLMTDPTNGQLVAAAVAGAQASATAAAGSATTATTEAGIATTQAAAAAASAATVNLSLFLAKANNLAQLGNNVTALANIGAADIAGNTATGRWAPHTGYNCEDFNTGLASGWYAGDVAAVNVPVIGTAFLLEVTAYSALFVAQRAYPFLAATGGVTSSVTPYRRYSYDSGGGVLAWTPWESAGGLPVGSTIWINDTVAPPGFIKENGALISRASFPRLAAFALASSNIVSEAAWLAGSTGAFSTGDLATTIRLPDSRGEFIRAYDDSRGIDSGRTMGSHQVADNAPHSHGVSSGTQGSNSGPAGVGTGATIAMTSGTPIVIASEGGEGRPRNNVKLACIKW
jgi:hypothetical protein